MFVVGFCLGTFVPLYTTLSRDCKQAHTCDCSDTAVITVTPTATSLDRNDLVGSPSGSFSSSRKVSVTEAATMATGADKSFVTTGAVPSRTIVTSKKHGGRDDNGDWHTIDVYVGNRTFFYQEPDGKKALESWSHLPIPVETNDATTSARMGAWYGQAEQDVLVASLLGYMSGGYYIDLASNEAFLDSNTFALDRFWGWKGLCIDANPQYWLALARLRTCQVLGAAVGGQSGTVSDPIVFKLKGGHGGLVHADFDNKKAENVDTRNTPSHIRDMGNLHVIPVPISDILRRYNVPTVIDYMSLDVEGAESYVMVRYVDTMRELLVYR